MFENTTVRVSPKMPGHGVTEKTGHEVAALKEDLSARKPAEAAGAISETRYRLLFETARDGIMILDAESGQITDVNPFLVEMLGYSREEFIEKRLWEIGSFREIAASRAAFAELQQKECLRYEDLPLEARDGRLFNVEFVSNVYTADRMKVMHCNIRDITGRKRAEQEIEVLNANLYSRAYELEVVNQQLDAFNYTVSHDLRKQLTAINGYSQMVRQEFNANYDEQCQGYLQGIHDGIRRLNELIETLLNFARLTRNDIHLETVDLSKVAWVVAAELMITEPERRVTFKIAKGVTVDCDPKLLNEVMESLIGNAWKYTGKKKQAVIEFGMSEVEGRKFCFVRDNGVGFDMAHTSMLFSAFQRLPGAEEFTGFGIGLATVQRIIQLHGGRVWAAGEAGKGATFSFTLS